MSEPGTSELGPVDAIVLGFPGRRLTPAVLDAMDAVEERGDIRLIDTLVVVKDAHGNVSGHEIGEHDTMRDIAAELVARRMLGLTGEEDIAQIAEVMPPDSLVVVLFVENLWARDVAARIREDGGRLLSYTRLPQEVVDQAEELLENSGRAGGPGE
jgi:hypothetical protein